MSYGMGLTFNQSSPVFVVSVCKYKKSKEAQKKMFLHLHSRMSVKIS